MNQVNKSEISVRDLIAQGKIELLDVAEAANCDIGFDPSDLLYKKCTHIEMHVMAILGIVASMVPFPHHN